LTPGTPAGLAEAQDSRKFKRPGTFWRPSPQSPGKHPRERETIKLLFFVCDFTQLCDIRAPPRGGALAPNRRGHKMNLEGARAVRRVVLTAMITGATRLDCTARGPCADKLACCSFAHSPARLCPPPYGPGHRRRPLDNDHDGFFGRRSPSRPAIMQLKFRLNLVSGSPDWGSGDHFICRCFSPQAAQSAAAPQCGGRLGL
jgi:hypothetical protein